MGLGGDQEEMVGRCGQLMAGWGWMSRLAGDASCQLERLRRGCPSVASSRGLRGKVDFLQKQVPKGARWKGAYFKTYHGKSQSYVVGRSNWKPSQLQGEVMETNLLAGGVSKILESCFKNHYTEVLP